jgi:hypothetical protein
MDVLRVMRDEIVSVDDATVFITEKIGWFIKNIVKRCRKNYYGVFDRPVDPVTGDEKYWVPLTESSVSNFVRAMDFDQKDIYVRPRKDDAVGAARVLRMVVDFWLNQIKFGELLDQIELIFSRDGTCIVKSWLSYHPKFDRRVLRSEIVDRLNFYIDPTAKSIQEAGWVTERSVMTIDEFKRHKEWDNVDKVEGDANINSPMRRLNNRGGGYVPYVEVYERWGKIMKSMITKRKEDENVWIDGVVIASNIFTKPLVHKVMENPFKDKRKPYEEARFEVVDGRWDGRGLAEKLFGPQTYLNTIINIRKNNSLILQNGLFEIRKGSGITNEMIGRLYAGGAVLVGRLGEDIKQIPIQDYRQSSYSDEERIIDWSQRIIGSQVQPSAAVTASTPATTALIKQQASNDVFGFAQEQLGHFIKRLFERHYIPLIVESLKENEVLRITGSMDQIAEMDRAYVDMLAEQQVLDYISRTGYVPSSDEVAIAKEQAVNRIGKTLKDVRFVKTKKEIFDTDFDIAVDIDAQEYDKTVVVQQLRELLLTVSRALPETNLDVNAILKEILDIMGLKGNRFFNERPTQLAQGAQLAQGGPSALDMRTGAIRTQTAPTQEDIFSRSVQNEQRVST